MLDAVQARACQFLLGIRKNTSYIASRGELGWLSNKLNVKIEILRHWNKLCSLDNDHLIARIHNWSLTLREVVHGKKELLTLFVNFTLSSYRTEVLTLILRVKPLQPVMHLNGQLRFGTIQTK